ncbi:MAG: transposase family protein [Candidatus Magasanikbacteria bacterium]|nr:transposase family protein [Candidatus Magasanikbacteria bacterium]
MNMTTKNNIYQEHLQEWLKARKDKKKRGKIVENICFIAGVHPKSVPRSFRRIQMHRTGTEERRGRKTVYTPDVIAALKDVWDTASEPCAENLHGVLSDYVHILVRDKQWKHCTEATTKLLAMSLGAMKKRVVKFARKRFVVHGKSTTSTGAIHTLIPVRSGDWDTASVGTEQIDIVAHCGHTLVGDFIYTVNATDVPTLWGARRAQLNKGQTATVTSMVQMIKELPFPVVEWHPDSGSEFINWHCHDWCEEQGVRLTRSRPNRKNDNCFVEERNGHIVRRWVGYTRLDATEVVSALNSVYDVLTPYLNHFVASRRIVAKKRIGALWKVTREKRSKTPYQRVLERNDVSETVKTKLRQEHETLNPLTMKREIDRRLQVVFSLQKHCGIPELEK